MVKRKAELLPQSKRNLAEVVAADTSNELVARLTGELATDCPTVSRSPPKGTDTGKVPIDGLVDDRGAPDLSPFWEMLRVAGYEVW